MKKPPARRSKANSQPKALLKTTGNLSAPKLLSGRVLPLAQARGQLSPLLKEVQKTKRPVGISVHGHLDGYLVDANTFERLLAQAKQSSRRGSPKPCLRGSITLLGDLEKGSRRIDEALKASIRKSAAALE